jgi:hypothetical protein
MAARAGRVSMASSAVPGWPPLCLLRPNCDEVDFVGLELMCDGER